MLTVTERCSGTRKKTKFVTLDNELHAYCSPLYAVRWKLKEARPSRVGNYLVSILGRSEGRTDDKLYRWRKDEYLKLWLLEGWELASLLIDETRTRFQNRQPWGGGFGFRRGLRFFSSSQDIGDAFSERHWLVEVTGSNFGKNLFLMCSDVVDLAVWTELRIQGWLLPHGQLISPRLSVLARTQTWTDIIFFD